MTKSPIKFSAQNSEGLRSRWAALEALEGVLENRRTINLALDNATGWKRLKAEDRAFTKLLILETVRHLPEIDHIYSNFLDRPLPTTFTPFKAFITTWNCAAGFFKNATSRCSQHNRRPSGTVIKSKIQGAHKCPAPQNSAH